MKAYLSFVLIPLAVGGAVMMSPGVTSLFVHEAEPILVKQLTLPPGSKDVKNSREAESVLSLRLEALMPSNIMEKVSPPPVVPIQRTAVERFRLSAVLLSPDKRSAVINGEVKLEGARLDEYRISNIGKDAVTLKGPNGIEKVALDSIESKQLFRITKTEKNKLSFAMPVNAAQTPLPPDELERQFRRLLENFSH